MLSRIPNQRQPARRSGLQAAWLTAVVLTAAGYSGGCRPAGRPPQPTHPVTVSVRYDGKTVAGATVMFAPQGQGYACQGVTDRRGEARLSTFRPGDGAVAGEYDVAVLKHDTVVDPTITMPDPADERAHQEACEKLIAAGRNIYIHTPLLPTRYAAPRTSGLTATVRSGSRNRVTLELEP